MKFDETINNILNEGETRFYVGDIGPEGTEELIEYLENSKMKADKDYNLYSSDFILFDNKVVDHKLIKFLQKIGAEER